MKRKSLLLTVFTLAFLWTANQAFAQSDDANKVAKEQEKELKKQEKEQKKAAELEKQLKREKAKMPPQELFLRDTDKYSKFDVQGIPTHDKEGKEISRNEINKLRVKIFL